MTERKESGSDIAPYAYLAKPHWERDAWKVFPDLQSLAAGSDDGQTFKGPDSIQVIAVYRDGHETEVPRDAYSVGNPVTTEEAEAFIRWRSDPASGSSRRLAGLLIANPDLPLKDQVVQYIENSPRRWKTAEELPEADSLGGFDVRPQVLWFAQQMEAKLQANDHKGGWENESIHSLIGRLGQEWRELHDALFPPWKRDPERVAEEAADVANFTMMIAGVVRKTGPEMPGLKQWARTAVDRVDRGLGTAQELLDHLRAVKAGMEADVHSDDERWMERYEKARAAVDELAAFEDNVGHALQDLRNVDWREVGQ